MNTNNHRAGLKPAPTDNQDVNATVGVGFKPTRSSRKRMRLKDYDYATPGAYFVTICTYQRACLFGEIIDFSMKPNEFGQIVETYWHALSDHYQNVFLDAFVLMPNHVHGIIELKESASDLSEIIRGFKTFSARLVNKTRSTAGKPLWQRGYYEHIIRSEITLGKIRRYIEANPAQWVSDKDNPVNIGDTGNRAGLKPAPTGGQHTNATVGVGFKPTRSGDCT